jgi:hypothetical protein
MRNGKPYSRLKCNTRAVCCQKCGKPVFARVASVNHVEYRRGALASSNFGRWLAIGIGIFIAFTFGVRIIILGIAMIGMTVHDKKELQIPAEMDVKTVAFGTRASVERVFGMPSRYEQCCTTDNDPKFDVGRYKWGEGLYDEKGHASNVWYNYKTCPHSLEAALRRVGLSKTTEPLQIGSVYRWCSSCTPSSSSLFDGNLKFNVTVMTAANDDGFSAISVSFAQ